MNSSNTAASASRRGWLTLLLCAAFLLALAGCGQPQPAVLPTAAPASVAAPSQPPTASPTARPSETPPATPVPPSVTPHAPAPSATRPSATTTPTEAVTTAGTPTGADTPTLQPPATSTTASQLATEAPSAAPPTQGSGDFSPSASSVWNTTQTSYSTNGGCASSLSPPYGLVELAPATGGLLWNDQSPDDYVLARQAANVYQYSGPNRTGSGTITLGVTFSSATDFVMARAFVPADEPGCTHTHTYSGVFQWYR